MRQAGTSFSRSSAARWIFVSGVLMALVVVARATAASECSQIKTNPRLLPETIGILYTPDSPAEVVKGAIVLWHSCAELGYELPIFLTVRVLAMTKL